MVPDRLRLRARGQRRQHPGRCSQEAGTTLGVLIAPVAFAALLAVPRVRREPVLVGVALLAGSALLFGLAVAWLPVDG